MVGIAVRNPPNVAISPLVMLLPNITWSSALAHALARNLSGLICAICTIVAGARISMCDFTRQNKQLDRQPVFSSNKQNHRRYVLVPRSAFRADIFLSLLGLFSAPLVSSSASAPMFFVKNIGQTAPRIQYYVDAAELRAGFTTDSVIFQKHQDQIRVTFVDSNPDVQIEGSDQMSGSAHFFTSGFSTPRAASASLYRTLLYRDLYPGIDLNYSASGATIKSEFVIRPGAKVETIRLRYPSDCRVSIDPEGDLLVRRGETLLQENAPSLYQDIAGRRVTVQGTFRLLEPTLVAFQAASYDLTQPLTIDPVVTYATYLGGSSFGAVTGIVADSSGNLYATGWTEALNFPIVGAAQAANGGGVDAFVVKFNAQGNNVLYATYIGGSGDDRGAGIAVDSSGNAYVTGATESQNFPLVSAAQPTIKGTTDAFVLKLNPIGNQLIYSTYLGGSGWDAGVSIAVDSSGTAYVAGNTQSADFPLLKPVQATLGGGTDAFVTALSAGGAITFSTFLGGASDDIASSIATDSNANIYITGGTYSSNFPTVGAIQGANAGGEDVFITKLKSGGGSLIYSTYLGGNGTASGPVEQGASIAADASGNAYVAGVTNSANFPTTPGVLQPAMTGVENAFIAKLSPTGSALVYSTYLGGSSRDVANAIAVAPSGTVWVAGFTSSLDFPLVSPLQSTFGGMMDAFVAQINGGATALSFSTFFGGSRADIATSLALDAGGDVFVGGQTNSIDLPLTAPYGPSNNAGATGWLMKFGSSVSKLTLTPTLSPASGTYSSSQTVTISTTTSGASIRYTVNGATPSETVGTVYSGPITVSSTTTINAIAYAAGQTDSSITSATYTIQLATVTKAANASVVYSASSQNVTLTATVTTSGGAVNSGAVAFTMLQGTTQIGSPVTSGTVTTGTASASYVLPAGTAAGSYTIQAVYNAGAGFAASSDSTHTLTVGPAQAATPTFSPAGGTYSSAQSVTISTTTSGASIRYTTDGSTPTSSSTVYSSPITVSATTTLKTYASASGMTDSSVASATYSWAASAPTVAPVGVSPASGSGLTQAFKFTFTDTSGYADLNVLDVLVSTFMNGQTACYFALAPTGATSGYLYLVDDAGDGGYAPGSPMPLPSNSNVSNSQCTVNGTGSSISASGNTLTLTLSITFNPLFGGNKAFYMAARSKTQNSGWQALGTWNVPGAAAVGPAVGGVSPAKSTSSGQTYTFTFTDTKGFSDLLVVDILTNSFLNGVSACYIAYVPTTPTNGYLYLVDDAGDGGYVGPPVGLSSGSVLQNSQCAINTAASSASASGNTLTLNLALTFTAGFSGNQVFFLAARNKSTGNSGWQAAGSVIVP
jgi:hypothetical protein